MTERLRLLGVTVDRAREEPASAIDPLPDVSWRILDCTEPSWTDPEEAMTCRSGSSNAGSRADPTRLRKLSA